MMIEVGAVIALLIPVLTEIMVKWDEFPLERKNAPIAVLVMSFLLAIVVAYANGEVSFSYYIVPNLVTIEAVFGYTTGVTAIAAFMYEYLYKVLILRGIGFVISQLKK